MLPRCWRHSEPRVVVTDRAGRRPVIRTVLFAASVLIAAVACGQTGTPPPAAANPTTLNVVGLGDSDASGEGDPGAGWVGDYADLLRQRLGVKVSVHNLAENGTASDALLQRVLGDAATRALLANAQIVLIGAG
jgi:hypothetical protein